MLLLRQNYTAVKFCKEFIALASNESEVPEQILNMAFMIGLKPKIRAGVKMFEPRGLKKMMSTAKKVEEWSGDTPAGDLWGFTGKTTNKGEGDRAWTRGGQ